MTFGARVRGDSTGEDLQGATADRRPRRRRPAARPAPAVAGGPADRDTADRATASRAPAELLAAEPIRLAFPPTGRGEVSETRRVRVTNLGPDRLELVDALVHGPGRAAFQVLGIDDVVLDPGAGTHLHLVFRPTEEGTQRAFCTVETDRGFGMAIPLIGRVTTAGEDRGAAAGKLATAASATSDAAARAGDGGIDIAPTYRAMEVGFERAVALYAAGDRGQALALARAVRDQLAATASRDRVTAAMRAHRVGIHAPLAELAFASDAARDLALRIAGDMLPPAVGASLLQQFRVGRLPIELATGETEDASELAAFDSASWLSVGVPVAGAALVVAGVAVVEVGGAAAVRLAPAVIDEIAIARVATAAAWRGLAIWAVANPVLALACVDVLGPMAGELVDDPDEFFARLETPEGLIGFVTQLLYLLAHLPGPGGAGAPDEMPAPARPRGDRGVPQRALPPEVDEHFGAAPRPLTARGRAMVDDALARVRALAAAIEARRGMTVPRARSTPVLDGDEPAPTSAAADAEPVLDRGTTLGERYRHGRHQRQAARAEAEGSLYDGDLGEGATVGRELRARGAQVRERLDDELMGDAMVTYVLPNRRTVTVRERGAAPPREQRPRDPEAARALQAEAISARASNADRAAATDAVLRGAITTDASGAHVDRMFDRVIVGGGPTAVELYATRPEGAAARARMAAQPDQPELSTLVIDDGQGSFVDTPRPLDTGQAGADTARMALDRAPRDLVDGPIRFLPARAIADAAALTADHHALPMWRGTRALRIDQTPDATWRFPDAARRLWVRTADGREVAVYTRTLDVATGLGPPRSLDAAAFGADPSLRADRRAQLEQAGVLVSAQEHLTTGTRSGATRVLISGGGATAPWNARLATDSSPGAQITWISRGGATRGATPDSPAGRSAAAIANAEAELADVELHLARRAPDEARLVERQAALRDQLRSLRQRAEDLDHGLDAMQLRNLDPDGAFGMANVRRVIATVTEIQPVEVDGVPKARVTLSNGETDVYDQVIVNHGADPSGEGSAPSLLRGEELEVVPTGRRAHIASTDRAVRVFGAASMAAAGGAAPEKRIGPDRRPKPVAYERSIGLDKQPTASRGVPSFHLTGEQIREANR